jgi:hypothetical protein
LVRGFIPEPVGRFVLLVLFATGKSHHNAARPEINTLPPFFSEKRDMGVRREAADGWSRRRDAVDTMSQSG